MLLRLQRCLAEPQNPLLGQQVPLVIDVTHLIMGLQNAQDGGILHASHGLDLIDPEHMDLI